MKIPTVSLPGLPPLLKSRKYWTAVFAVIVGAIVSYIPELEAVQSEMILLCTFVFGMVIHGYAEEDKALAAKTGERNPKYTKETVTAKDYSGVAPQ
jgi:hypothetical protein